MPATLVGAAERSTLSELGYAPTATVSTALLLPQDRIPRGPLTTWAERLASDLVHYRRSFRKVRDLCAAVARNANNTALVASMQGAASVARLLCQQQISWHYRLSKRSRDPAIAAHAVQPWVNLARLDGMSGDWRAALARLARLQDYRARGRTYLGFVQVPESGWQVAASTRPSFEATLDAMYVIDSLKVLLLNREFTEVLAFASHLPPDCPDGLKRFVSEASAVAAARLGDAEGARRIALTALEIAQGWERVVFKIRIAEISGVADTAQARNVAAPVVAVIQEVSPAKKSSLQILYILQRLSTLCREIGMDGEACSVAKDVYDAARAAGDEVFEIESLRTLSVTAPSAERGRWREALSWLEESTLHQRYHRGEREVLRSPVLDGAYQQLSEFLTR